MRWVGPGVYRQAAKGQGQSPAARRQLGQGRLFPSHRSDRQARTRRCSLRALVRRPLGAIRNSAKLLRSASTSSARVGKTASGKGNRAFAIASLEERRERGRLWERATIALNASGGVQARSGSSEGDAADRMAEDLDRRLRHVLVIIRRTRLAEGLQLPGLVLTRFDICPGVDPGEAVEPLGAGVWPCPAAEEDGVVSGRAGATGLLSDLELARGGAPRSGVEFGHGRCQNLDLGRGQMRNGAPESGAKGHRRRAEGR